MDSWRSRLVEDNLPLVKSIASDIYSRLPAGTTLEYGDIEGWGHVGLVQAAEKFDVARGVKFSTFAYYRIRGAIYDELRRMGLMQRNHKLRARAAMEELLQHQDPKASVQGIFDSLALIYTLSLEQGGHDGHPVEIGDPAAGRQEVSAESQKLRRAMQSLRRDERLILEQHYFSDMDLAEIARQQGYSKAWASRLHAKAIARLREAMTHPDST